VRPVTALNSRWGSEYSRPGSTARWLADDPSGELKNTQVPTWGESVAIRFILEPVVKRTMFKSETEAREGTPWHLMTHVLNLLAHMELTRRKVTEEAVRALELHSSLKKGKNKATEVGRGFGRVPGIVEY
jgi:hypothetical protein